MKTPEIIKQLVALNIRAEVPKEVIIRKMVDGGISENESNKIYAEMYNIINPYAKL
jgi:hypothetical protein